MGLLNRLFRKKRSRERSHMEWELAEYGFSKTRDADLASLFRKEGFDVKQVSSYPDGTSWMIKFPKDLEE